MNLTDVKEKGAQHLFQNYGRMDICFTHGKGAYLYDEGGKEYLDLVAGIAVNSIGHSHPEWVKAISDQAGRLCHVSNLYHVAEQAKLAGEMAAVSPANLQKVLFVNSGAEANEAALKLAVKHTGKGKVLSATDSFHGRTSASLGATGQTKYESGFGPLISDAYRYFPFNDAEALKDAMDGDVAAVLLEPIQGESGIRPATKEMFRCARDLCDDNGALLVVDEVQTGIGRTGEWFGIQHLDTEADIMCLAKGLGGGFPIGAIMASDEVASSFTPGSHGTTFGGSPLACASASAVLSIMHDEGLVQNSRSVGESLIEDMRSLDHPDIAEVRGKGLMIGMEMRTLAKQFQDHALKEGILVNVCHGNVVRLVPPLIVTGKETGRFMEVLKGFLEGNP